MTERVTPYSPDQIGSGVVRFSSKGVFETHKDHMVDPYAHTRMPKEAQVEGAQFWPQDKGRFPCIVLLHERWGLTSQIKDVAVRLACEGFVVMVPNLYGRQGGMITANEEVANALANRLDSTTVLQDIKACCEYLNANIPEDPLLEFTKRNVHGIVGFDMGGTLAFQFACQRRRLRAAVSFYGQLPSPLESLTEAFCPLLYHAAEDDDAVSSEDLTQLEDIGKNSEKGISVLRYPQTRRGFCNTTQSALYNAEATSKAWSETVTFLQKHLSI